MFTTIAYQMFKYTRNLNCTNVYIIAARSDFMCIIKISHKFQPYLKFVHGISLRLRATSVLLYQYGRYEG